MQEKDNKGVSPYKMSKRYEFINIFNTSNVTFLLFFVFNLYVPIK